MPETTLKIAYEADSFDEAPKKILCDDVRIFPIYGDPVEECFLAAEVSKTVALEIIDALPKRLPVTHAGATPTLAEMAKALDVEMKIEQQPALMRFGIGFATGSSKPVGPDWVKDEYKLHVHILTGQGKVAWYKDSAAKPFVEIAMTIDPTVSVNP